MKKPAMIITVIFVLGIINSPALAKRAEPKPVNPIIKDGIEYSAPLEPNQIGFVIATWQKTKRVIWNRQIYTVKYEYKRGLEKDVQWFFISKLRLADNKLIITNELGYEYELDLDSLSVKVLKSSAVIDKSN